MVPVSPGWQEAPSVCSAQASRRHGHVRMGLTPDLRPSGGRVIPALAARCRVMLPLFVSQSFTLKNLS